MHAPGRYGCEERPDRFAKPAAGNAQFTAINVLNHPVPNAPNLNINTSTMPFGYIQSKGDQIRQFKAVLRLNF